MVPLNYDGSSMKAEDQSRPGADQIIPGAFHHNVAKQA